MFKQFRCVAGKIQSLFRDTRVESELEKEIATHIAFLEDEFRGKGLSPAEARLAANRAAGGVEQIKQLHRNERSYQWLTHTAWDIRYAFRTLRRSPGFTIAVILTIALGIGANTAVFSVVDAVLLKPLGYPHPDRIVRFMLTSSEGPIPGASVPDFHFWLEHAPTVQDISAYDFTASEIGLTGAVPEQVHAIHVTANYFRLFGAPMLLGRAFISAENSPHGGNVVVISYGLWKRRFGGNRNIVGKGISLEKEAYTVIGVTGQKFKTDPEADLWLPFQFDLNTSDRFHDLQVAGRLNNGVTFAQANAQLKVSSQDAHRKFPLLEPDLGFEVQPLRDAIVRDVRSSLWMMLGAVGFVLLIACANVANLLLVRATARVREFAIRAAIGAGRGRIVCQLATESVILSSLGGVLGLTAGLAGVRALLYVSPGDIPRIGENGAAVGLDWRVLLFTLGTSLIIGLAFGLVPALSVSRPNLNSALTGSRNVQSSGFRQNKVRSLLVVSEISLSVVLLVGAALLIRTFISLREVKPGFDHRNVLMIEMPLRGARFPGTASVTRLIADARLRLSSLPGVEASAETCSPPYGSRMGLPFNKVGVPSNSDANTGDGEWIAVTPGYFEVLKIPVLRGRDFDAQDSAGAPGVVLINQTMAKRYWPNQDAVGQEIVIGKGVGPSFADVPRQVIGVVGDTRDDDLSQSAEPTMIIPQAQEPDGMTALGLQFGPLYWLVRTRLEPHQVAAAAAEQLREASGGFPVGRIRTMDEILFRSISRQDFNMLLLSVFAFSALVLAAVGIYGVMAYSVAQRTHEIGIRMALGADRATIHNLVLRQGMSTAIVGVLIGLGSASLLVRLIASYLFGVKTHDPLVFAAVPALLGLVAFFAIWLPARRAAGLEPTQALRIE